MKIRTGLRWLIGLSGVGIAIATVLIFTCPFAGVISFSTLVREGTKSYEELTIHATAIPGVRELPAKVLPLFGSEVSFLGIFVLLTTWKRGRNLLFDRLRSDTIPLDVFLRSSKQHVHRVSGTAIYMTGSINTVPHALLHPEVHPFKIWRDNMRALVQFLDEWLPAVAGCGCSSAALSGSSNGVTDAPPMPVAHHGAGCSIRPLSPSR